MSRFMFVQDIGLDLRVRSVTAIVPEGVLRGRRKIKKRFALSDVYGDNRRNAAVGRTTRSASRRPTGRAFSPRLPRIAQDFGNLPRLFQRDRVSDTGVAQHGKAL